MKAPILNQAQMEALADILVLAIYADGHVSLLEDENLNEKIESLDWDENQSPSQYLGLATAKARKADSLEESKLLLHACAKTLESEELKQYAFDKTMELLQCDGFNEDEGSFVHQIRLVLGV